MPLPLSSSSSSLDGLIATASENDDTITLKITTAHMKHATMFVLTTATLAAGLLAQLPQLGVSAEILEQRTIASSCLAFTGAGLLYTFASSSNIAITNAAKAFLHFATGEYSVAAAEKFHNHLIQQADLTLAPHASALC